MDVAVLHPHDCLRNPLKNRYPRIPLPLKSPKKSNPVPNPNQNRNRRRRSPEKSQKSSSPPPPAKNLVIGQVKILKRGEPISSSVPIGASGEAGLGTTARLGPDPDLVQSQVHVQPPARSGPSVIGFFAGSVVTSPPASSLPVPVFCTRTRKPLTLIAVDQDHDATSGLRRLLGLN